MRWRWRDKLIGRQTNRQTEKQIDRQTYEETDKQTNRQTKAKRTDRRRDRRSECFIYILIGRLFLLSLIRLTRRIRTVHWPLYMSVLIFFHIAVVTVLLISKPYHFNLSAHLLHNSSHHIITIPTQSTLLHTYPLLFSPVFLFYFSILLSFDGIPSLVN